MQTSLPHALVITASEIPDVPPCCEAANERGYRRGYKDGYTYAFCDAGAKLSDAIWQRFWRFREERLLPWMRRSWGDEAHWWEGGPRFGPAEQKPPHGTSVVPHERR